MTGKCKLNSSYEILCIYDVFYLEQLTGQSGYQKVYTTLVTVKLLQRRCKIILGLGRYTE